MIALVSASCRSIGNSKTTCINSWLDSCFKIVDICGWVCARSDFKFVAKLLRRDSKNIQSFPRSAASSSLISSSPSFISYVFSKLSIASIVNLISL